MSNPVERAAGPAPELFAGDRPGQVLKRLFFATRPKFFPASVLPVLAGTAWGVQSSGQFDAGVFLLGLIATVFVHAASNVLNDVGDDTIGTDRHNEQRIYPYTGGSRFIQTGILDKAQMTRLGIGLLAIATLAGIALIATKGPVILLFGLIGVALAVIYSLGPLRLSGMGLGEAAVAVGLGLLPVTGAAWLQGAAINAGLLLYALPVSAWVAAILLINEVPDISADGRSGKRTLPVRMGLTGTAWLYLAIQLSATAAVIVLTFTQALPLLAPIVPLGLLVLVIPAVAAIRNGLADREKLTGALEATLAIHTLGVVWLSANMLYLFWFAT